MDERTEQIRVLDEVILLFETRFVELNDYINTRVNLDNEAREEAGEEKVEYEWWWW